MARSERGFALNAQKIRTRIKNDTTFAAYFTQLKNLAENTFKWEGLPHDLDPIFIEKMLFQYGLVAIFKEPVVGLVALPAMQAGGFNIYGAPEMVRAFSPRTGYSKLLKYSPDLDVTQCVLLYNTNRDLNSAQFKSTLGMYAERLTDMKRTEEVNVHAQRTPVTVVVPEGQVETYANLLDRYENFGQTIFGYKGLDPEAIKSVSTLAPYVANQIDELFIKTWNEAIGFLGISNVSIYKKERVTQDEVARSMGGAIMARNTRQEPRERAIELVNAKYGEKWKVTFSEDLFDLELFGENNNLEGYNREESKGENDND